MPASQQPFRVNTATSDYLKPHEESTTSGAKIILNVEEAKGIADSECGRFTEERYVIAFEEGYVVLSQRERYDYFGDPMKEETIYTVVPSSTREKKRWPGE